MVRIQVIVGAEERELFRQRAKQEGLSLSAWLRAVAQERLKEGNSHQSFRTPEELQAFFVDCDKRESHKELEPDWESHLSVIQESRAKGTSTS